MFSLLHGCIKIKFLTTKFDRYIQATADALSDLNDIIGELLTWDPFSWE